MGKCKEGYFTPHPRIESWISPLYLKSKIRVSNNIDQELEIRPRTARKMYTTVSPKRNLLYPLPIHSFTIPLFAEILYFTYPCFAINIRALTQLLNRDISL